MSGSIWDVQVRNLGAYTAKNFSFGKIAPTVGRWVGAYRAKYVTCKNARMTPFWHLLGVCIVLNYVIDYKFHLKHEKLRKYH